MGRFLTDTDCINQRNFVNIPAWYNAGYKGKGLTIFCDDVKKNSHYLLVKEVVEVILPEARVLTGNIGYRKKSNEIIECNVNCFETGEILPFDNFITKYNVSLINNSTDGGNGTDILPEALFMREKIKQYNLIVTGAAGNGNATSTTQKYNGACFNVTSCVLENGRVRFANKACGENIDFSIFSGFQSGTSFSAPFLLGLIGLIRCKYPNITQSEIYEYLKSYCMDLGVSGKDVCFGWGLPILPSPKRQIVFTVGSNDYYVDGIKLISDIAPVNNNGNVFVPLRVIGEALGKTFVTKAISNGIVYIEITDSKTKIEMTTGSKIMVVSGIQIELNLAPYIFNNRTLVPVRAIVEAFNCNVEWVQALKQVKISER